MALRDGVYIFRLRHSSGNADMNIPLVPIKQADKRGNRNLDFGKAVVERNSTRFKDDQIIQVAQVVLQTLFLL